MKGERLVKVNELIAHALAERLGEVAPARGIMTVTGVETSPDLRQAKVWVSLLGGATEEDLEEVKSELRRVMGGLKLKYIPKLEFRIDTGLSHADRIERIFREL